jgi:plasmid stabilization system protein ParE
MARRKIVWTETAILQRRKILEYWNENNGSSAYSIKLVKTIKKYVEIIADYPQAFKLTEYPETRAAALGHYSIFYKMFKDQIIITAFWDNRQNPDEFLA